MTKLNIYADGGSRGNPGKAAAAFVAIEKGKIIIKKGFYVGKGTNNEAEYLAVIYALRWLVESNSNYKKIIFFLDSELLTKQLNGKYKIKSKNLIPLMKNIRELEDRVPSTLKYNYVPREKNRLADFMVNKVLDEVEKNSK